MRKLHVSAILVIVAIAVLVATAVLANGPPTQKMTTVNESIAKSDGSAKNAFVPSSATWTGTAPIQEIMLGVAPPIDRETPPSSYELREIRAAMFGRIALNPFQTSSIALFVANDNQIDRPAPRAIIRA